MIYLIITKEGIGFYDTKKNKIKKFGKITKQDKENVRLYEITKGEKKDGIQRQ